MQKAISVLSSLWVPGSQQLHFFFFFLYFLGDLA